ncbi:hypothetical protein [Pelagimonas varians]|uniref:Phage minor tail protein U n=1 Tax=Pelagimonas varians TaxID=696760 RepID=A0A238KEU5_9RHOB|nr:hypothetical protein [Pelagimonas varians]PYG32423.1 hypothetical protein C8N36_103172 [Pelagimonas varians]SMX41373.1 hypothetical protein PEV8663_02258 [Pelagimonas varians]
MSNAVIAEAISRLTAALPGWRDATGAAHPTPEGKLPAFAVRVTYTDAERLSMDDPREMKEGQLEVELSCQTPANDERGLQDLAGQFTAAIFTPDDDLAGTAWQINRGSFEADHGKGESRLSTGALTFPIQVIE